MQAHLAQNHQWVNTEEEERMQRAAFPDPQTLFLGFSINQLFFMV